MQQIKLIIGLGNPGKKYEKTRHNIGFTVVNELVSARGLDWQTGRFAAELAEGKVAGQRIFFLKPLTYMNKSGESVAGIVHYYKIDASELLVIHDDLDLPLGRVRITVKGSAGGHNGIKSIIQHLGTDDFTRLKIGIGRPPNTKVEVVDHVLAPFLKEETQVVAKIVKIATQAVEACLQNGLQDAMNQFNGLALN